MRKRTHREISGTDAGDQEIWFGRRNKPRGRLCTGEEADGENENRKRKPFKRHSGVGANIERYLNNIGIFCVADLVGRDPEELYRLDCLKKGFQEDRCALYVYRCAVYYAEQEKPEAEKLKWWYWKDREYPER